MVKCLALNIGSGNGSLLLDKIAKSKISALETLRWSGCDPNNPFFKDSEILLKRKKFSLSDLFKIDMKSLYC